MGTKHMTFKKHSCNLLSFTFIVVSSMWVFFLLLVFNESVQVTATLEL